jgi:hypothetical protein
LRDFNVSEADKGYQTTENRGMAATQKKKISKRHQEIENFESHLLFRRRQRDLGLNCQNTDILGNQVHLQTWNFYHIKRYSEDIN